MQFKQTTLFLGYNDLIGIMLFRKLRNDDLFTLLQHYNRFLCDFEIGSIQLFLPL